MTTVATTRVSSKGQVVIPEAVRKEFGIQQGTQYVVTGNEQGLLFTIVKPPPREEFDRLLRRARAQAKAAGMKPSDVRRAIREVRHRRHA